MSLGGLRHSMGHAFDHNDICVKCKIHEPVCKDYCPISCVCVSFDVSFDADYCHCMICPHPTGLHDPERQGNGTTACIYCGEALKGKWSQAG